MLTMARDGIRAVQVAGTTWVPIRAGTLRTHVIDIADQATAVLTFVDDSTGEERTIPRLVITQYDGELVDLEAERRQAQIAAERLRLANTPPGRREITVDGAVVTLKAPSELHPAAHAAVRQACEAYIASGGATGVDPIADHLIAAWRGAPQPGEWHRRSASNPQMAQRVDGWRDVIGRDGLRSALGALVPGLLAEYGQTPPASNGNGTHPEPTAPRRK
jgi:hypothetical protein